MSTTFGFQKFVANAQQFFAFTSQANFPIHNLNFHWRWRWWDPFKIFFTLLKIWRGNSPRPPRFCRLCILSIFYCGNWNLKILRTFFFCSTESNVNPAMICQWLQNGLFSNRKNPSNVIVKFSFLNVAKPFYMKLPPSLEISWLIFR